MRNRAAGLTSLAARAIEGLQQQRCKVCWKADGFNFNVPDTLWRKVVPRRLRGFVVCLSCFDKLATEKGVDALGAIHALYFAGQRSSLALARSTCSCSRPSSTCTRCRVRRRLASAYITLRNGKRLYAKACGLKAWRLTVRKR